MSTIPTSPLVEVLDAQATALAEAEPALATARETARAAARTNGIPTTRQERWKYTTLRALAARRFDAPTTRVDVDPNAVAGIPSPRLVIANGRYAPALSDLHGMPEGLRVRLLSDVLREAPNEASTWLSVDASAPDTVFQQWNGALAEEGFALEVEPGMRVSQPLHLVVLGVGDGAPDPELRRYLDEKPPHHGD